MSSEPPIIEPTSGERDRDVRSAAVTGGAADSTADTDGDVADDVVTDGDVAATYCATLVDEWAARGLRHAVISPGSRSTPMALALASHELVTVHVHHDERCASFMALGLAAFERNPVAVLCTSGTAAAQFHAAVVEAHQSNVPLLVLTADRPPELQGVGAPQTIDQRNLFTTSTRWFCEPGPPAAGGSPWWRDLARDAWNRCNGERPGPVHLNLAFREPLLGCAGDLPPGADQGPLPFRGARWGLTDERLGAVRAALSGRRGVIIAGDRAATTDSDAIAVHRLGVQLGWPILADGPSGCRRELPATVTAFDSILRHEPFADTHRPDVVLRLGGLLASKALERWLSESSAIQIGIDSFGICPDPSRTLDDCQHVDVATAADQIRSVKPDPAPGRWMEAWTEAESIARSAIERVVTTHSEVTEPGAAIDVAAMLSDGGVLVASSSMPVRDLEWFAPARDGLRMMANRGANGIDGVVSTAVGAALGGAPTALLIGDVAFLHDSNGLLGLMKRDVNLVVVVIDNDGGGIFSFLPQRDLLDDSRFEQLFGTPHGVDLRALAAAHGVPSDLVTTRTGFQAALAGALTRGGPRLVVVRTTRSSNVDVHAEINDAVASALGAS